MEINFLKFLAIVCCTSSLVACGGGGGGGGGGNNDATVSTTTSTGGSINPTSITVQQGTSTSLTVSANSGFTVDSITGCNGTYDSNNNTFTTGNISSDCTVTVNFLADGPQVAIWDTPESIWDDIVWQ